MKEVYEALNVLELEIEKLLKVLVLLLIDLDQVIKEKESKNNVILRNKYIFR